MTDEPKIEVEIKRVPVNFFRFTPKPTPWWLKLAYRLHLRRRPAPPMYLRIR